MRHSRKKISVDDIPLISVSEKLREKHSKIHFKRDCCEKQNHSRKQSSESKGKESNSSAKKSLKKKKYLEEEVQKMLQKRILNEEYKFNQIRINNVNQIECLKGDMQAMKEVINKLSVDEWNSKKPDKNTNQEDKRKQLSIMCEDYAKKIEQLSEALAVQREINSKLQEAHIQSQLFAKQTKDYSETINKELSELAIKHIACQSKAKALEQSLLQVKYLENQLLQAKNKLEGCYKDKQLQQEKQKAINLALNQFSQQKATLQQEVQLSRQAFNKIREQNTTIFNQNRQLADKIKNIEQQLSDKQEQMNNLLSKIGQLQRSLAQSNQVCSMKSAKVSELESQATKLMEEKHKNEEQLSQLQAEFNSTKKDLGSTEVKLRGLVSMEKKCEQLYEEIKNEKQRWDHFNMQSVHQKQKIERELNEFKQKQSELVSRLKIAQTSKKQVEDSLEKLKKQNKALNNQKNKLTSFIEELEQRIQVLEAEVDQIEREKQAVNSKLEQCQQTLEEKESAWRTQKGKFQSKIQWLQKQKNQIEYEVKGTLEVAKRRNDQIQSINQELKSEIANLKQQKQKLENAYTKINSQLAAVSSENDIYKTAIGAKETRIIELSFRLTQIEDHLLAQQAKSQEYENKQKRMNSQWVSKYDAISKKLDSCLSQLKECKETNIELQRELTDRDEKINNLSTIRQDLEQKLNCTESRLHVSETARLSLSSEFQEYQLLTKRNEEGLKEDKNMYEVEISKKNRIIQELRETIKLIKEQSFKIQDQMDELRKLQQFEEIATHQMQYIQKTLQSLTQNKNQLAQKMALLTIDNQTLIVKIAEMEKRGLDWVKTQQAYFKNVEASQRQKKCLQEQLLRERQRTRQAQNELKVAKQQAIMEKMESEQKLSDTVRTLSEVRFSFNQTHKNTAQLISSIKQKEAKIEQLTTRLGMFEQKKRKVVNEVHSIQNQISEMGLKNNLLEETNKQLEAEIKTKQEKLRVSIEKNKLLVEANAALEQQIIALSQQVKLLKDQVSFTKQTSRQSEEKSHRSINEVYEICQARKSEAVNHVKQKLQQLATELSSCINKLNAKNQELQACQKKCDQLKEVLEEKQKLLTDEKQKNQQSITVINKLNNRIDRCQCQLNAREIQIEAFNREKTIMREKMVEQESKFQILKRKFDHLQQQKGERQREIENQNISLRVLREQNKNIEKVMSEQINQRKTIIEQLVNEKKMLYSQLHHQR